MKKLFISHSAIEVSSYRFRSLVKRIVSNEQPRDRSSWLFALRCWLVAAGCSLLVGLAGCGPASSDNAPSLESRASVDGLSKQSPLPGNNSLTPVTQTVSPVPLASVNGTGSSSGTSIVPGGDNIGQGDKLSKPAAMSNVETDGRDKLPVPGIPESIAKGLDSPDARSRLQALDHWEKKGVKQPSLDPVFEALEDEDDAVRAKATAIIEQQWAIEHERERG